tara:strand:+ start:602 stop:1378 length:777 start_codon:yes stop_codon:yes gene_type:complete
MTSLTGFAEDYVKHALKQQSSSDKKEQKRLKKIMDKSRKDYIDNYIIGRDLYFKRGIMGCDKRSKASLKKAEQAFDRHMQSVVTQINEETDRKNKLRRQQLEKRKAEEKAIQERINNECTKIQTKEECVNEQNINNCYWNVNLKKNQHGDTLWKNTCQKITKRSIQIGKPKRKSKRKPSSLGSIPEEGGESKELSTNALTVEQRRLLNLEALNPGKDMSAGKRKRKTRKRRKRRRTKKKRRKNKRKSKKNKRKSKRRR